MFFPEPVIDTAPRPGQPRACGPSVSQKTINPKLPKTMKLNPMFALAAVAALGFAGCDGKKTDDAKAMIEQKGEEAKDAATSKIDEAKDAAKEKDPGAAGAIDKVAEGAKDATGKAVDATTDAGKAAVDKAAPPK